MGGNTIQNTFRAPLAEPWCGSNPLDEGVGKGKPVLLLVWPVSKGQNVLVIFLLKKYISLFTNLLQGSLARWELVFICPPPHRLQGWERGCSELKSEERGAVTMAFVFM